MDLTQEAHYEAWDTFLREWPIERLPSMSLAEYTGAGNSNTFTAWLEQRLDKLGSIWGGSAFKFGIYSRKNKTEKASGGGASYNADYAWYSKYGATSEQAFATVRGLVTRVAQAASRGDFAAIDDVDLGTSYKWKIAFHYQDRARPGVIAVFKRKRLQQWLHGRIGNIPDDMSALYREVLALNKAITDLVTLSDEVWTQTAPKLEPGPGTKPGTEEVTDEAGPDDDDVAEVAPEQALNLILYGPPGTGKTYRTAELAVRICDGKTPPDRKALMNRYRELKRIHRIRFVTFHPSFTYEEFVEGIRPSTDGGQVRYDVRPGIFKQVVVKAREHFERRASTEPRADLRQRRLWKMSLGNTQRSEDDWIFVDCVEKSYVGINFAGSTDFAGSDSFEGVRDRYRKARPEAKDTDFSIAAIHRFKNELRNHDLVLISDGNRRFRALAEVVGPYQYEAKEAGLQHMRAVRWLWTTSGDSVPIEAVFSKHLSQMTIYRVDQDAVNWEALQELIAPQASGGRVPNCVLIIDEINRANLAKTFGELITLLEPTKRLGAIDEQETALPYSGDRFGIPPNLYVIGTMNTADRSIALLDVALRRRFEFREMAPMPELLPEDLAGVKLRQLLAAMNARIEALVDRDHTLGHTYLMGLVSFDDLANRFRNQIIPLLQEYFFDDWGKMQVVFNDQNQMPERQIVQQSKPEAGKGTGERLRFQVSPALSPAAIQKIYE